MEKTIKEWLSELPGDLAAKALNYTDLNYGYVEAQDKCESLERALNIAFQWNKTAEGYDFWSLVAKHPEMAILRAENEALKARIAELEPKPRYVDEFKEGDEIWVRATVKYVDDSVDNDDCTLEIMFSHDQHSTWFSDEYVTPENIRRA